MRFMPYSLEELSANDGLFKQRLHSIIGMPNFKVCRIAVSDRCQRFYNRIWII